MLAPKKKVKEIIRLVLIPMSSAAARLKLTARMAFPILVKWVSHHKKKSTSMVMAKMAI